VVGLQQYIGWQTSFRALASQVGGEIDDQVGGNPGPDRQRSAVADIIVESACCDAAAGHTTAGELGSEKKTRACVVKRRDTGGGFKDDDDEAHAQQLFST
jgi:hypothetical protein